MAHMRLIHGQSVHRHGLHSVMGGEFGPSHACSNKDVGKSERKTLTPCDEADPKTLQFDEEHKRNAQHHTNHCLFWSCVSHSGCEVPTQLGAPFLIESQLRYRAASSGSKSKFAQEETAHAVRSEKLQSAVYQAKHGIPDPIVFNIDKTAV